MTDTFTSYTLLSRDLAATLKRKAAQPTIARETAYYEANIGKVKTADDLLADQRLYRYAMTAHGLEDMIFAKGMMRKVLAEGVDDPKSYANRLTDERYKTFARAYDLAKGFGRTAAGTDASASGAATAARVTGSTALTGTLDLSGTRELNFSLTTGIDAATTLTGRIVINAETLAAPPLAGTVKDRAKVTPRELVGAINAAIAATGAAALAGKVRADLDATDRLVFTTTAFTDLGGDGRAGGTGEAADRAVPATGANRTILFQNRDRSDATRTGLDIGFGLDNGPDAATRAATASYVRQSLETDAGAEDTGVRLALYFERIGPEVTTGYGILGDTALTQVVNTVLNLPTMTSPSSEALARRAKLIEERLDLKSFQDPEKRDAFLRRFAAIWDAQNNTASAPVLALFSETSNGIGADILTNVQAARIGA